MGKDQGNALWNTSVVLDSLGDRDKAVPRAEEALRIREQIGDPNALKVREWLAERRNGR